MLVLRKAPHWQAKWFCCWAHLRCQRPWGGEDSGCGHGPVLSAQYSATLEKCAVSNAEHCIHVLKGTRCLDLGADLLIAKLISAGLFSIQTINFHFRKETHPKLKPNSLPKGKNDYWIQEELALLEDVPRWHAKVNGSMASMWQAEFWSQRACVRVSALLSAKIIKSDDTTHSIVVFQRKDWFWQCT